jgi:hypothetical protein
MYMNDGGPVHFSRTVRGVLNNSSHDQWVGTGGPTAWLPRFTPDLNPLDCYLCVHLKSLVCMQLLLTVKRHFSFNSGCRPEYPQLSRHLWTVAALRDETCWGVHWISWTTFWAFKTSFFSCNMKIKCFWTRVIFFLLLLCEIRDKFRSYFSVTQWIHNIYKLTCTNIS